MRNSCGLALETCQRAASATVGLAFLVVVMFVLGTGTTQSAHAQTYKERVLYSFTGGVDGSGPRAGLIFDAQGNLYGTTRYGGASGNGVVFKRGKYGKETVLYNFTGGADGANPGYGALILDANGNLYGTTVAGGTSGNGVVFKVNKYRKETVLYSFTGGADGGTPRASLILDANGNLYGVTSAGGTYGNGVVFKVNKYRKETVLYSFIGGADGADPRGGLIFDANGNLYGTTLGGDVASDYGTVFKVNSKGQETVLYRFTGGADGAQPVAGLIFDAQGNLYGTTSGGDVASDYGTVFKVNSKGQETVLYRFTGGADGANPEYGALIFDANGNVYGTTYQGGASGAGVVFKLGKYGHETVLYSFTGGADGANPVAGLIFDAKGNLYSTAFQGGASGAGTVFKLAP